MLTTFTASTQTKLEQDKTTVEIVKEAVIRNVVWMLSSHNNKVAHLPELAYIEQSKYSIYRETRTFQASETSYRLLMFQELMRRTVLATSGGKTLDEVCKNLFDRQGAPPEGSASKLASEIAALKEVKDFPAFFKALKIATPSSKERFTTFLRKSIEASHQSGYSKAALTPAEALFLRRQRERGVEIRPCDIAEYHHGRVSFFPR